MQMAALMITMFLGSWLPYCLVAMFAIVVQPYQRAKYYYYHHHHHHFTAGSKDPRG